MRKISLALLMLVFSMPLQGQNRAVIADDIANFWKAYDQIVQTSDSLQQIALIGDLFIQKGTPGLQAMMQAKRYTAASYVHAIRSYPKFWNSIRANTLRAKSYADEIERGIEQLKRLYPEAKPAKIYFTMGALWSNGTTIGDKVLIGSELAMCDFKVITTEIAGDFAHLPPYFKTNPVHHLGFLNVHEYVHTQQKTTIGNHLLAQTVLEGVAEFVAEKALRTSSPNEQIAYGRKHVTALRAAFVKEMFSTNFDHWIWNNADNAFKMRDLAYAVGYGICEKYYLQSTDKRKAIREMIELDYNNEHDLRAFVEKAGYFEQTLAVYQEQYEKARPKVLGIQQFANGSQSVDPQTSTVTLLFSQAMDSNSRGFEYGPLGEEQLLRVQKVIGYAADRKSFSFEIKLEPNKRYQVLISDRFLDQSGLPLKPYLIDIATQK